MNLLDSDEKDTYFNNNLNESCERVYTLEREETTEDQNDIDKVFGKLI